MGLKMEVKSLNYIESTKLNDSLYHKISLSLAREISQPLSSQLYHSISFKIVRPLNRQLYNYLLQL
jgi:hypothetical protein